MAFDCVALHAWRFSSLVLISPLQRYPLFHESKLIEQFTFSLIMNIKIFSASGLKYEFCTQQKWSFRTTGRSGYKWPLFTIILLMLLIYTNIDYIVTAASNSDIRDSIQSMCILHTAYTTQYNRKTRCALHFVMKIIEQINQDNLSNEPDRVE